MTDNTPNAPPDEPSKPRSGLYRRFLKNLEDTAKLKVIRSGARSYNRNQLLGEEGKKLFKENPPEYFKQLCGRWPVRTPTLYDKFLMNQALG